MSLSLDIFVFAFFIFCFVQIFFQLFIFIRIWFYKEQATSVYDPVSVIIYSKNQQNHLQKNLGRFLNQDYPKYEVVVVSDVSMDNTLLYLDELAEEHDNLNIVSNNFQENDRFSKGKKFALTLGIKAASYDTLLFSSADSYPSSNQWIKKMQSAFTSSKRVVLSYSSPEKSLGFLNKILRFESLYEGLLRFSLTLVGVPLLADSRNLAYDRNLFFSVNGFFSHLYLSRGEAELFVEEVCNSNNTEVCMSFEAKVLSSEHNTWKQWMTDKRTYFHFAKKFRFASKFILTMHFLSLLGFWLMLPVLLFLKLYIQWVCIAFIVRLCLQYIVYWGLARRLNETKFLLFLPFYEVVLMLIHFLMYLSIHVKQVHNWD